MIDEYANTNTAFASQASDANEQGETRQETGRQLRERLGVNERAFQSTWKRTFEYSFNANRVCTNDEVNVMDAKYAKKKEVVKRFISRPPDANERPAAVKTEQAPQPVEAKITRKKWLLWSCLFMSLACSIPNMYWVALAMKGSIETASMVTAAFTVAPFLLLAYGIQGPIKYAAYVPIAVEVFCNSAGFYGGMTGLSNNLFVTPTPFLHMVTTMTNSAYEGTAFILAISFAVCISILAIVPVYEIEKATK